MNTLYDPATVDATRSRLNMLTPETERLWGKMNAAQMLAHCANAMESAVGDRKPPRLFIGRLLGRFVKAGFLGEKPLPKNSPTAPWLVISGNPDFVAERERLLTLIDRFQQGGPDACTQCPHAFFGPMTPEEWGVGMYKHLDHHLRQFGV